jgi:hypothetical protein
MPLTNDLTISPYALSQCNHTYATSMPVRNAFNETKYTEKKTKTMPTTPHHKH